MGVASSSPLTPLEAQIVCVAQPRCDHPFHLPPRTTDPPRTRTSAGGRLELRSASAGDERPPLRLSVTSSGSIARARTGDRTWNKELSAGYC